MLDNSTDDSKPLPVSRIMPGPAHLRNIPLMIWWPGNHKVSWMIVCWTRLVNGSVISKKCRPPLKRFVDLSRLTEVAVRTSHVFEFARKRAEQFAGVTPVKSAFFSEDWIGFGIACMYEGLMKGTPIDARAFRDRATAAVWLGVPAEILKLEDKPAPPH